MPFSTEAHGKRTMRRRRRIQVMASLLFAWTAIVMVRLGAVMIVQRDSYLAAMHRQSWRVGTVPAERGTLYDRTGRRLAWSTRHFRLLWRIPSSQETRTEQMARLKSLYGGRIETDLSGGRQAGTTVVVVSDLTPGGLRQAKTLCTNGSGFRVESYFARHRRADAHRLPVPLGRIRIEEGVEVGVSGLERLHDHLLRGRPGRYRVMVDKHGDWVPGTWEQVQGGRPGDDVHLRIRLAGEGGEP